MQKGKFNIVVDGQHGSTGKGLINSYLAWKNEPEIISCTNMPNAGHTAILPSGKTFVAKALPSSAILNGYKSYYPEVVIGAGAAFTLDQLHKEIIECGRPHLTIHERAGVVTEEHRLAESANSGEASTKHIASTMQGCGAFLASKILRGKNVSLARNYNELNNYVDLESLASSLGINFIDDYLPSILIDAMKSGKTILHEGSQGFSLDINHGSQYPQCTSRSCTVGQSMTDMGIPHQLVGDVYIVVRPYPIRVGNVVENGVTVGESGGCYSDNVETTWRAVSEACGAPPEVTAGELTTVTKRLRRVFTWSDIQFARAVAVNGATKICLNFANYIDWSCYGVNDWYKLGPRVLKWIDALENKHGVRVELVGTGPRVDHVCTRP